MKTTLKFSTLLVAFASVFTFSSCLNNNNNGSSNANYYSAVTITGNDLLGYTFYADFGSILIPTTASIQQHIPYLGKSGAKRAYIAFDLESETENGKDLIAGQIYNIVIREHWYGNINYAIPTAETLLSKEESDTLHTNNESIINVKDDIWAANGYVNAQLTLNYYYEPTKTTYALKAYYTENDIDVANNTLNLNLYYNNLRETTNNQGSSVISFRLPEEVIYTHQFSADSINLVLNAITGNNNNQLTKVGECKVALKDFSEPMY